ncbi:MAG: BACON domain-containing protein [Bacteroidaceae bacterium]|nr:BACON domain-containing protein [Bacteroidaceae bacterium]
MKKLLIFICLWALVSCVESPPKGNFGYPEHVTFGPEGGEKLVEGVQRFYGLQIGNTGEATWDSIAVVTNQWLTVKGQRYSRELQFVAEPNTTGKERTKIVWVSTGQFDAGIKVKQTADL